MILSSAMYHPQDAPIVENLEFNWGKKRGVGGKKKEVQFYESFAFDGDKYSLYDCVYLYKEGEPEPYIGKIIKIWEQPEHKKKVKVLWFFRPIEIKNWLRDFETLENEIFLASGEGVGVANINPLEAIAGKCNVVCTSKDNRNPQPSEEELRMADYVFRCTFNVDTCTISDKINEKIGGIEVKYIFNGRSGPNASDTPKFDAFRKEENGNVVANNEVSPLLIKSNLPGSLEDLMTDENPNHTARKENGALKASLINQKPLPGENVVSNIKAESKETEADAVILELASVDERTLIGPAAVSDKDEGKTGVVSVHKLVDKEKLKCVKDHATLDDRPLKKAKLDNSLLSEKLQPSISPTSPANMEKNESSVPKKLEVDVEALGMAGSASEEKSKSRIKDSLRKEKGSSKLVKFNEKTAKLSNGKLLKTAAAHAPDKNIVTHGKILEVTRKPTDDRSKWFKGLPWEERMRTAHDQGTLVLLENLDPAYISSEIEDIVWHGFRENCTARVVPRTAISSPHSGQAFVIFKSRDAAEMAIRKLDEGCLLLPNGRPLIGSRGFPPSSPATPSPFMGHIFIDQIRRQMQRDEMRKAVSTSHCSQPNTVEYEMAMDWCLLQARSDSWWKDLYKQHGNEIRKLKANLKFK